MRAFATLLARLSHLPAALWVIEQESRPTCQRHFVARLDEQAAATIGDDFGKCGKSRGDHRPARGHCLQRHVDAAMRVVGDPNDFAVPKKSRRLWLVAKKVYPSFDSAVADELLQTGTIRPIADED